MPLNLRVLAISQGWRDQSRPVQGTQRMLTIGVIRPNETDGVFGNRRDRAVRIVGVGHIQDGVP